MKQIISAFSLNQQLSINATIAARSVRLEIYMLLVSIVDDIMGSNRAWQEHWIRNEINMEIQADETSDT